jgi:hypothetical protein
MSVEAENSETVRRRGRRKHIFVPGQTFALVLVTASTRISFFFVFFSHSAALPLFHPKNVKAGTQRKDFF